MVKVGLITIGNEILLGKTLNTNLAFIGQKLSENGFYIQEETTVRDSENEILQALKMFWDKNDIVITTGGLGPTIDDITKQTIAKFFDKDLMFDENIWSEVQKIFTRRNIETPEINRNQALVPNGFVAIKNKYGTAPGLYFKKGEKMFFALPGVPHEMKNLFEYDIIPILKKQYNVTPIIIKNIHTIGITESRLAELLSQIEIPEDINMAYLPQVGRVDLRLYGHNEDNIKKTQEAIEQLIGKYIWGYDEDSITYKLHSLLASSNEKLAFAESCTGGLIQKMITDFAGSSSYFVGGIVSYSNQAKINLLGVKRATLDQFGAVSKEVAIEMVEGVQKAFGASIAGAVTGIAGPGGGTKEKPVGTVHIAVYIKGKIHHNLLQLNGDRETIRIKTAEYILSYILNLIS